MKMERFLHLFRVSRDLHEIEAMSARELADLGVTRAEAMELAALPDDVPQRVTEMARVFGLDPSEVMQDRRVWHELLQNCHHCHDLGTCHRFMAREEKDEPVDTTTLTFCPNRRTFDALNASLAG
ncbi:DUF6455 family protein [Pararhodobacter sp. CCB-MM2]|uniref:DUF6455 family protein n=1 Tax=Pararhodobacter sp. CCB-MM2 TaxID=1786003 RepID=UPI00082EDC0E|nr:DUF6455 family protein [Pararhodobacter sp. CCB-MM2]MCA2012582.1 DUF6455 family protein [Cereibacter sphaeroides]